MTAAQQNPDPERTDWAGLSVDARRFVAGLSDFQFRSMVTPRMLPTIYLLGIVLSAILTLYLIASGFRSSTLLGVLWLIVLGPATFLALVAALRIGMEFLLAIFRLVVHVERLDDVALRIQGQTEEIAEDLPRIQFWRAFTRPRKPE